MIYPSVSPQPLNRLKPSTQAQLVHYNGTHAKRVLICPVHGNGSRHTSLTSVEVSPILDKYVEFEIPEKDLEITVPRPLGNINRPETWVWVFRIPAGISVFCDQERRQIQNQELALAILKSKLFVIALV
ncbi:MAG: peptide chain release factor-like protein [Nostoc sp.]|uniref:peptide chain release factor family protein n=1 Tax=Nostoc sp. TaxID=1180 RepID=UPI002FF08794